MRLMRRGLEHDRGSHEGGVSPQESLSTLRDALSTRPPTHQRNLSKGDRLKPSRYATGTQIEAIAEETSMGGKVTESLTQLIFIGDDTVLGISRVRNKKVPDGSRDEVRIMSLPMSGNATDSDSSRTLGTVRLRDLQMPGADGVVQPWRAISVGRLHVEQGITDPMVSRDHLTITVGDEGSVVIDDTSTNGTSIVESLDLAPLHSGLGRDGQVALADIAQTLQDNPFVWSQSFADRRVVNPGM